MFKKIFFFLVIISNLVQGQNTVEGTIVDVNNNYKWIILYQLKGVNQNYIANVDVLDGKFTVNIPQETPKGMYRLAYDLENNGFVDFLYNNESIELKFDPKNQFETLSFITSDENKLFNNYLKETEVAMQKLDSIQLSFFRTTEQIEKVNLEQAYISNYKFYKNLQTKFEEKSFGKLASHFIKSSQKYYAPEIIKTPQEYLNSEKEHFFDFVNFNDIELRNSIFISKKVIDYVFYLNRSDDAKVQNALYKNAVLTVMQKVGNNNSLVSELSTVLMYTFTQIQNTTLIDLILESIYKKLPAEFIDTAVINEIMARVKLAIGKTAPNFSWTEKGKTINLSQLNDAGNYMVVFWSTGCSHCLVEIPQLYDYLKDKENVHAIVIALEKDDILFKEYLNKFPNWTNVLGLEKWQNDIARKYDITSTPTFFVLDANKKIIAKPELFKDVKDFFEN